MTKSDKMFLAAQGVGLAAQIPSMVYQFNLAKQQRKDATVLGAELDYADQTGMYDYKTPEEAKQALNTAKMLSTQGLPAAQRQQAEQDIMRSQNAAINAATERGGGLNAIAGIQQSSNDAYRNLAAMDAQQKMQNIRNLQDQQQVMAGYKEKEWEINKYQEFQRKLAAYQALKGASIQNRMGGFQSIGSAGSDIASAGTMYSIANQQQPSGAGSLINSGITAGMAGR